MLGGTLFFANDSYQSAITSTGDSSSTTQEITVTNISNDDLTAVIDEAQKSVVGVVNYQYASADTNSLFGEQHGQITESTGDLEAAGSGSGLFIRNQEIKHTLLQIIM